MGVVFRVLRTLQYLVPVFDSGQQERAMEEAWR